MTAGAAPNRVVVRHGWRIDMPFWHTVPNVMPRSRSAGIRRSVASTVCR